jgi:hypothetical protein
MAKPTVLEIQEYYSNLLIVQYHNKPKAKAEIEAWIKSLIASNVIFDVRDGFNLDDAVGVQLDILDKYIGVGRYYEGTYIADSLFRFLMKFKAIQNNSNFSRIEIDESLYNFFTDQIILTSEGNMDETFFFDVAIQDVYEIALGKDLLPRPMAVSIDYSIIKPATGKVFCISNPDGSYNYPDFMGGFGVGLFADVLGQQDYLPYSLPHSF